MNEATKLQAIGHRFVNTVFQHFHGTAVVDVCYVCALQLLSVKKSPYGIAKFGNERRRCSIEEFTYGIPLISSSSASSDEPEEDNFPTARHMEASARKFMKPNDLDMHDMQPDTFDSERQRGWSTFWMLDSHVSISFLMISYISRAGKLFTLLTKCLSDQHVFLLYLIVFKAQGPAIYHSITKGCTIKCYAAHNTDMT